MYTCEECDQYGIGTAMYDEGLQLLVNRVSSYYTSKSRNDKKKDNLL